MLKLDFNKDWTFGNNISIIEASTKGIKKNLQHVDLPHDAMILTERSADNPAGSGGAYFQGGNYEYVKKLILPKEDQGKVVFLEFEGVYMNTFVYVNGDLAGKNDYGYTNFYVQINDFLRYGQENEVKLVVKNGSQPNSRWYTGSGIYRNVKLMKAEPIYIAMDGVRITTVDAEPDLAVLQIEIAIKNENLGLHTGYAITTIKDAEEKVVSEEATKFSVASRGEISAWQRITLSSPKLWDTDNPNLYTCTTVIKLNDKVVDEDITTFGIRKLQLDSVHGLRINGRTLKLKGGCIHHDNGVIGTAAFKDAEERRIRKLKEAGYNAIRAAHHPMGRTLLDACDKHGMLVMDELTDCWTHGKIDYDYATTFIEHWEQDVERMIGKDYNHPSIIMYSIGNELAEIGSRHGNILGRKIIEKIRSLDDTRYITNGVNPIMTTLGRIKEIAVDQGFSELSSSLDSGEINQVMQAMGPLMGQFSSSNIIQDMIEEALGVLDIEGYNYSPERYLIEHEKSNNKTFVGAESHPAALDHIWEIVKNNGFVLGDFSWTAWDYLGEVGIGKVSYEGDPGIIVYAPYPWITAQTGDFDITGHRLPISYWREIVWGGRGYKPYIAVQKPEYYGRDAKLSLWGWTDSISSWTWPGWEGKGVVVEVYSDAEEAELFINGKSQGRKTVGDDFKKFYCKWDTTFEPGEVEAVAYIGGKEVGRYNLKSAGAPQLKVTKEREDLRAGSNDLCYVNIELVDASGILNTAVQRKVSVAIEGPAVIQGSGTGRARTEENYFDSMHETYNGRMQVVVRAGVEKGTATLIISTEKSESVTIEIPVV
ncbi:glycoside hydrolase family 2 TIM barrel-domain containing protein [Paenibacillus xylanilyticus]|uniref:glycoside hydrolase family 2 TIM barrel-domain containing protein n=1 Tax=Paenibacillus xylanilyticus TaxID=248903 RepID=UPI0039A0BFE9